MKMVMALVSRKSIDNISKTLSRFGVKGMTLTEVKCPVNNNCEDTQSANIMEHAYLPMVKVEVAVEEKHVDELIKCIVNETADSLIAVDKICVLDLNESVRIRTGDRGNKAL